MYVSNEGKDVISNFKMTLIAFIKLHLMCMDYAPGVEDKQSAASLWLALPGNVPGRSCARCGEYTGRSLTDR